MNLIASPSLTAMVSTCLLLVICIYLYRQERDRALLWWSGAWLVFLARSATTLGIALSPDLVGLSHAPIHVFTLLFSYLFLAGVQHWAGLGLPGGFRFALLVGVLYSIAGAALDWSHRVGALVPSILSAGFALWAGYGMLRAPRSQGNLGAKLIATALLFWSIHSLDHPLTWEIDWLIAIDNELDAFFVVFLVVTTWFLYHHESRLALGTVRSDLDALVSDLPTLFWYTEGEQPRQVRRASRPGGRRIRNLLSFESTDWAASIHPEDFQMVNMTCKQAFSERVPFSLEYRLRGGDGTYHWVKDDGAPVYDASGRFTGYAGAATDITRQKDSERALQERERRLQILFDGAADAIFVARVDGRLVDVNDAACRSTGYTREELLALCVSDIDVQEAPTSFVEFSTTLESFGMQQMRSRHRRKDGSTFPVEVRVAFLEMPDGPLIVGTARDISEREREKSRHAQILAAAIDGFWLIDRQGHIVEANQAAADLLGYTVEEMVQLAVYDIDATEMPEDSERRISRIMEEGHIRFETLHRRKDGVLIDVEVSVNRGFSDFMVAFTRDISDRKRTERALRKSETFLNRSQAVGHIGSWEFDLATARVICSAEFKRIFQLPFEGDEVPGRRLFKHIHPDDWSSARHAYLFTLGSGESNHEVEFRIVRPGDGDIRVVSSRFQHERDDEGRVNRSVGVIQDITEQRRRERVSEARLRLIEYASQGHTSHELLQYFLDEAERLTDSKIGFFHFVEEDQETLSLQAWSTNTLAHMCTAEGEGMHYPISKAGVWVDCVHEGKPVIHNDYASLTHKKGLPEGHSPIIRQLVVPVFRSGRIVAILGVGNKPVNYVDYDQEMIVQLSDIAWDMVVRMRAEEALQASEAKFYRAFWNAPFLMAISTLEDGRYLEVNEAFYRTTGYSPDEVIGATSTGLNLIRPEDRELLRSLLLSTGSVSELELEMRHADGHTMVGLFSGALLQIDGEQRILSTAVDITERKHAQEMLERQNRAISLTKNMTGVFLTSPPDSVFTDLLEVVRAAADSRFGLFGYVDDNGDLNCPALSEVIWANSEFSGAQAIFPRERWGGIWGEALVELKTVVSNTGLSVPQGHLQLDNAIATPLIHQERAIGLFVLANRIGGYGPNELELLENAARQTAPVLSAYLERERKQVEHDRLEAQFRQAQKMEAIGQLTGGVAHDFNNLLQVIIGCSDILLSGMVPEENSKEILQQISTAGYRAARLVSQLLLFSRRQIMRPEPLNLNEVIADFLKMLGRIIGEHVQMRWHPAPHVDYVLADRGMVEQVLTNLCVNARDAMPGGGSVTIETRVVELSLADCAGNPEARPGPFILVSVSDNGSGMEKSVLDHIFEPFFTTKSVGQGTGLGLATVYGIVKQHGGVIDVDSTPGAGTTFRLYWPARTSDELLGVRPEVPGEDEPLQGGTETILLAEDDEAVRTLVTQMLESVGYTVITATDGAEAVALLQDQPERIDLVILDVVMPNLGGHDAYRLMKTVCPNIKVFFASGYSEDAIHKNFVLDDNVTLIQKPYTQKELLKTVHEVLARG